MALMYLEGMYDIVFTLKEVGFSEKEARAYLALLEIGESTAYAVAQRANIKKPTAHFVLDQLVKKGAVLKIPSAKRHKFIPKQPSEILSIERNRMNNLIDALPAMKALFKGSETETRVFFYEGISEIEKALWYKIEEMRNKEFVAFYASSEKAVPELLNVIDKWNNVLAKQLTSCRAIVPSHPSLKKYRALDKKYRRIVRAVPYKEYPSDYSIEIMETFIRILMIEETRCVIIENSHFAKTFTHIFEMVWKERK